MSCGVWRDVSCRAARDTFFEHPLLERAGLGHELHEASIDALVHPSGQREREEEEERMKACVSRLASAEPQGHECRTLVCQRISWAAASRHQPPDFRRPGVVVGGATCKSSCT